MKYVFKAMKEGIAVVVVVESLWLLFLSFREMCERKGMI
jgi:hypothetical protein